MLLLNEFRDRHAHKALVRLPKQIENKTKLRMRYDKNFNVIVFNNKNVSLHTNERQYHLDRGSKWLKEFFFHEYDLQFTDLSQNNQNTQLNSAFQLMFVQYFCVPLICTNW